MNKPINSYKPWTDDDLDRLRRMTEMGTAVRQMADVLGRTAYGVYRQKAIQRILTPQMLLRNGNSGTATDEHYLRTCGLMPSWTCYGDATAVRNVYEYIDAARDARDAISYPHLAAEYAIEAARWRNGG